MTIKTRSSILSLAFIVVLVFGVMSPTIAYADDGAPPTPPTAASNACTAEGDCPSVEGAGQPVSDSELVSRRAAITPEEPVPEPIDGLAEASAAHRRPATSPAPEATVLDQIPDNTTVAVLDAAGQSMPLASQQAAEALVTSDPIWCPQGKAPIPGVDGCTPSFTSFDDLLTFLSGNAAYQGAGTIYVQQGTYAGGETIIDFNSSAYDLSNIWNSDLMLAGGWDTATNQVDPAATSTFSIPIVIGSSTNPWGGSLIVTNITINKPTETGLTIHSQGDITLFNVNVTNSVNGAGAELHAGRDVNINQSKFDRNRTAGVIIRSGGNVAIANSSFSNPPDGRRQIVGLDILSNGSVALLNILANENREVGANINAGGRITIGNSFFSGTKEMKDSATGTEFLGYGLQAVTPDAIDLDSVEANDNFLWGAWLQAGGDVTIRDSKFNANTTESPGFIDDTGLLVTSGGNVALLNVEANDNRLIGATIDAAGDVAIQNSTFSNNNGVTLASDGTPTFHGYGIRVVAGGSIAFSDSTASGNTLFGAHLESGRETTVSRSTFSNQTSGSATDQTGRGLEIISVGNIFINDVVVNNNQTFGASLQASANSFLINVTASNNGGDGVSVQGSCTTVTLNGGTYENNLQYGLNVTNAALNETNPAVFTNNGAGAIFHDPGTCVFNTAPANNPGTGPAARAGNSTEPAPLTASLLSESLQAAFGPVQVNLPRLTSTDRARGGSIPVTGVGSKNLTLNNFLAHSRMTSGGIELSIFMGQYAYIYSDSGVLYIIALSPVSNTLALDGS